MKKENQEIFKNHNYTYKDSLNIKNKTIEILDSINKQGYFSAYISNTIKEKNSATIIINLGRKISTVIINHIPERKIIKTTPRQLTEILDKILKETEQRGEAFSETKLINQKIANDTLFTDLIITKRKTRKIDKTIIKGYNNISTKLLERDLYINNQQVFNKELLGKISKNIKNTTYIKEIKKPEVLFKKDSTILYLYIEKEKKNSFDGILNFNTEENGKLNLNGYLDISLLNTFNSAEEININWNKTAEKNQSLQIHINTPYVFNTRITPSIALNIFKQDSSFVNSEFTSKIKTKINNKNSIGISYEASNSNNTINKENSFNNNFFGINYQFNNKKNIIIKPKILIGHRKTASKENNQIKATSETEALIPIDTRNKIFLKNTNGIIISDNYVENELFRIGGPNTIRGYLNESIFSKNHIILNSEYRFSTNRTSYIYSIFDFARVNNSRNLSSIGAGYILKIKETKLNISYTVRKKENNYKKNRGMMLIAWEVNF